ncbi:MAG: hypothetical protein U9P80_00305 [Thermodesulfobacteriota bacterium]|nr:hypothetical protein [Thermodesulfobacteriota bacterium]
MKVENALYSHASYIKGISVELPFFRFRYLKVEGNDNQAVSDHKRIGASHVQRAGFTVADAIQGQPGISPAISVTGTDPLVSRASVIHELAYGRIKRDDPGGGYRDMECFLDTVLAGATHIDIMV